MAADPKPQPVTPVNDLQVGAGPIQVGNQIMVMIQVADRFGVSLSLCWPIDMARNFSRAVKDAVEVAETTIVKPPPLATP